MASPYDLTFGSSHVTMSNLGGAGTVALAANDTQVLVATVPLTTGVIALDVTTLVAEIYVSYDIVTNDGTHVGQVRDYPLAAYKGHATPASIASANSLGTPTGMNAHTTNGMRGDYYEVASSINSSGNAEIKFKGVAAGSKALTLSNLQVSYRIVGCK